MRKFDKENNRQRNSISVMTSKGRESFLSIQQHFANLEKLSPNNLTNNGIEEDVIDHIYSQIIKGINNGEITTTMDKIENIFVPTIKGRTLFKFLNRNRFLNNKSEDEIGFQLIKWGYMKKLEREFKYCRTKEDTIVYKNPIHNPKKKEIITINKEEPFNLNNYIYYSFTQFLNPLLLNNRRKASDNSIQKLEKLTKPYLFGYNILKAIVLHLKSAEIKMKTENSTTFIHSKYTDDYNKFCRELVDLKSIRIDDWPKDEKKIFLLLVYNTLVCHILFEFGPHPLSISNVEKAGYYLGEEFYSLERIKNYFFKEEKEFDPRIFFSLFNFQDTPETIYSMIRFFSPSIELENTFRGVTQYRLSNVSFISSKNQIFLPLIFYTHAKYFGNSEKQVLIWVLEKIALSESLPNIIQLYTNKQIQVFYGDNMSTNTSIEYERLKDIAYSQSQNFKSMEENISNYSKDNQKMKKKLLEKENFISKMKQRVEHYENLLKKSLENLQVLTNHTTEQKKKLDLSLSQLLDSPSNSSAEVEYKNIVDFVNSRLPLPFVDSPSLYEDEDLILDEQVAYEGLVEEFYETEVQYISYLSQIIHMIRQLNEKHEKKKKMGKKPIISKEEMDSIFSTLPLISPSHISLAKSLHIEIQTPVENQNVGKILCEFFSKFQIFYSEFFSHDAQRQSLLRDHLCKHSKFSFFLQQNITLFLCSSIRIPPYLTNGYFNQNTKRITQSVNNNNNNNVNKNQNNNNNNIVNNKNVNSNSNNNSSNNINIDVNVSSVKIEESPVIITNAPINIPENKTIKDTSNRKSSLDVTSKDEEQLVGSTNRRSTGDLFTTCRKKTSKFDTLQEILIGSDQRYNVSPLQTLHNPNFEEEETNTNAQHEKVTSLIGEIDIQRISMEVKSKSGNLIILNSPDVSRSRSLSTDTKTGVKSSENKDLIKSSDRIDRDFLNTSIDTVIVENESSTTSTMSNNQTSSLSENNLVISNNGELVVEKSKVNTSEFNSPTKSNTSPNVKIESSPTRLKNQEMIAKKSSPILPKSPRSLNITPKLDLSSFIILSNKGNKSLSSSNLNFHKNKLQYNTSGPNSPNNNNNNNSQNNFQINLNKLSNNGGGSGKNSPNFNLNFSNNQFKGFNNSSPQFPLPPSSPVPFNLNHLTSFFFILNKPFQRLFIYPYLIRKLIAYYPKENAHKDTLKEALKIVNSLLLKIFPFIGNKENEKKIVSIQNSINYSSSLPPVNLLQIGRVFFAEENLEICILKEGTSKFQKWTKKSVFFFSDLIMLCDQKKKGELKMREVLAYETSTLFFRPFYFMKLFQVSERESSTYFEIKVNHMTKYIVIKARDLSQKLELFHFLSSAIMMFNSLRKSVLTDSNISSVNQD